MAHPSLANLLAAAGVCLGVLFTACSTKTDPAPAYTGPRYLATVRVESVARGVGLKVNGQLVTNQLPADIKLEVSEDGMAIQSYRVYLNRNILPAAADDRPSARTGDVIVDPGTLTLEMGQPLPARIRFDGSSPVLIGTAVVERPK